MMQKYLARKKELEEKGERDVSDKLAEELGYFEFPSMEIKDYYSWYYTGKAMKMGAGVAVHEAYEFADSNNVLVVGGNCPTVGLVGGYTQGGGHGPLASKFGLGADQVLEWEVVTGTGQLLTATPNRNSDLYWALCGGGGGTYGAVVSLTVKAYPSMMVSAANMTFPNTGSNADEFLDHNHFCGDEIGDDVVA